LRLLLDTHIILWRLTDDNKRLSKRAMRLIDEDAVSINVSAVSVWEIAIKWAQRKGRVNDMPTSAHDFLAALERAMIKPMPIQPLHAAAVEDLPLLHADPFDRLLLATAKHEGMTLLTHDNKLADYGDFVLVV
jgi:PIN domain nuclease of toxin-antitoxin system